MRRGVFTCVVVVALTVASCGSGSSPHPTVSPLLPKDIFALPSFDFDTYEALLEQLRGTPVVVNIWASWCGPCRNEAPELVAAAKRYGTDVRFLGVDIQDQRPAAVSFMKEYSIPYPSVFDAPGEIHDRLGFVGLPDTVFYDADGHIAATWTGPLTSEALSENIAALRSAAPG